METIPEVDVVIVGGGIAGFTAAVRAVEIGLRALLLEKTKMDPSWSNTRISGGCVHPCALDIEGPAESIVRRMTAGTDGTAEPELVEAFAAGALPALRWLQATGVQFEREGPEDYQKFVLAPHRPHRVTSDWEGYGPDVALRLLKGRFVSLGGQYRNGHRCVELVCEGGRVKGLLAETVDGEEVKVLSPAVVLADGGFQANLEMVKRYITRSVDRIKLRGTDSGTGDGIRMAQAVGAKLFGMSHFYGHIVHLDGLRNAGIGLYPHLDHLVNTSIMVWKTTGARFVDEGLGGTHLANELAKTEDPQGALVVFDEDIWSGPASEKKIPVNPNVILGKGTFYSGGTLDDLAGQAGIEAEGLRQTVTEYNRALARDPKGLAVPRSGNPHPIEKPPFHAIPLVPGITHTMGGMLINPHGQVLNEQHEPISGLWAAGTTTAGLEGGPRCAYAGGLLQSVVFGMRAAEHIKAQVASRQK